RQCYFDTLVHDPGTLRFLIELCGPDRVFLGSDFPFPLGEEVAGSLLERLDDLGPQVVEQILAANALAFLGLAKADLCPEHAA
ncbi:MAG: amidohydrolase family protein, partial [Cyanobacteria bacterium REEB65]|nr:amidohydrolase family protein [Cyanobacteria bacterium REEB65]